MLCLSVVRAFFLAVPWAGMQSVIVVFPGQACLHFIGKIEPLQVSR